MNTYEFIITNGVLEFTVSVPTFYCEPMIDDEDEDFFEEDQHDPVEQARGMVENILKKGWFIKE